MIRYLPLLTVVFFPSALLAADPPKKEPLKITPGKVIVPTDAMRRPWANWSRSI